MSDSLRSKTIKGAGWSFIENISNQGIAFLIGIVLARLLSPTEYGLIGIITIFTALFDTIVDSGFTNALIRKHDADDKDFNTVFVSNLLISIALGLLLFFCAPLISEFFKQPELTPLTRAMSCIIIINALCIVQRVMLTKRLDFKKLTKISVAATTISGVVGILMAFYGYGVWSLVMQQIVSRVMQMTLLFVFNRWKPSLTFSRGSFKELFGFSWKILVSSIINNIWKQVYTIVIGKCYTVDTLGLYSRARHMSELPSVNLTNVVQRVSFPALSNIHDDNQRQKQAYIKVIKLTMYVTFACMLGMAACAKSLIMVLIGEQWLPCVPYLQIICFQMMLYPLHAINLNMLQIKGRSDLFLIIEIVKKIIGVIPILLGVFVGIYWMLFSSVIIGFFDYWINSYYSGRLINYSFGEQVKDILPSFFVSSTMSVVVFGMSYVHVSEYILLPLQFIVGIGIIVALSRVFRLQEYWEIKNIVLTTLKKKNNG